MSLSSATNRRRSLISPRYSRNLYLAGLDPVEYGYNTNLQREFGKLLDGKIKEQYLASVSSLVNLQLLTEGIRNKEGLVVGHTISLTEGLPVRIDMMDQSNNINFTRASSLTTRKAVYAVLITNSGAGLLRYSLNTVNDNGSVELAANAPTRVHREEVPTFEIINLIAVGNDCTVNIAVEL